MNLHRRLVALLTAFAAFALLATFATIYAVRFLSEDASESVRRSAAEARWVEGLRGAAREQRIRLREIMAGVRAADALYLAERDAFLDQLRQVAQFTLGRAQRDMAERVLDLTGDLRAAMDECLQDVQQNNVAAAQAVLQDRLEGQLLPALDLRLQNVGSKLNEDRSANVNALVTTHTQVLILSLVTAGLGMILVAGGVALMRRWILRPVHELETAAHEFAAGHLDYRVPPLGAGELGGLGGALNRMAAALTTAQAGLSASEAKYRALFSHLRDATLICDAWGTILEFQDSETGLLQLFAPARAGQSLAELWRTASRDDLDWPTVFGRLLTDGRRIQVSDVRLRSSADPERSAVIELFAFPLKLAEQKAVAVVLRDITAQRRSELQARRTDAMEATVTLARGVAHDFSNLLSGAIGALSLLSSELTEPRLTELVRRALRACGQAVSLARTLLTFAGSHRGSPEVLPLGETVELIMSSLDEDWLKGIAVDMTLNHEVRVLIDRDQFTEVVVNLVRNACEAMPGGGRLRITLAPGRLPAAIGAGPSTHAVLTVADTGCGLSPQVKERVFEPFFTTKQTGPQRSRGLGLAVVYAAVKNAGGVVQVESQPGSGTNFHVWLPLTDSGEGTELSRAGGNGASEGAPNQPPRVSAPGASAQSGSVSDST